MMIYFVLVISKATRGETTGKQNLINKACVDISCARFKFAKTAQKGGNFGQVLLFW